jgi:hypothetical protein
MNAKRFAVLVDGSGRFHIRHAGDDGRSRIRQGHYRHMAGGEWTTLLRVNAPPTVENVQGAYLALIRVHGSNV